MKFTFLDNEHQPLAAGDIDVSADFQDFLEVDEMDAFSPAYATSNPRVFQLSRKTVESWKEYLTDRLTQDMEAEILSFWASPNSDAFTFPNLHRAQTLKQILLISAGENWAWMTISRSEMKNES